jgi:F0F1-type ATP synthase assembly protein I
VPDEPDRSLDWSALLGMGAVIAAELVAGLGLGWLVDVLAGTTPIFLLTVVEFRKYLKS